MPGPASYINDDGDLSMSYPVEPNSKDCSIERSDSTLPINK